LQISNYILTYEQAYRAGREQVGIKAYNLSLCNNAGFLVPQGMILSNQAFLAYLNGEDLEEVFLTVKDYLIDTKSIIVRSSALDEDKDAVSFAGQYLSMICPNKVTEIKRACEACWSSYSSPHINAYSMAMEGDSSQRKKHMGLLIQKLVSASSAGVCFTKDPLNERKDVFIINAVHGLGESLVAGEVVADQYLYDLNSEEVVSQYTGKQSLWCSSENPKNLTALPLELQNKPVLSSTQIKEIEQMARKAVKLFGTPQDIEWAYEGDKLFLLQARPITRAAKKEAFELWTRDNVADVIPDAVTPLTWSVVKEATNNGFKSVIQKLGIPQVPSTMFKVFDGRVYFNKSAYQSLLTINYRKPQILKVFLNYLRLLTSLKKEVAHVRDFSLECLNTLPTHDRKSVLVELKNYLDNHMAIHIRVAVLMELGFLVIRRLIKNHIPEGEVNALIDGLVTGLEEIESTVSGEALWELSCLIRGNEELSKKIIDSPNQSIPNILSSWGEIYSKKWQQFLKLYGHSSLKEFELYYPRWIEDPGFITSTLKQYIIKGSHIDLKTNKTIRAEKRMKSEKTLLKYTPLSSQLPLTFYINHIRQCSIWRESIKQKLVKLMAEIRTQVLAFADEHSIAPSENVFFLTLEEILHTKDKLIQNSLLEKIATRKKNWEKWGRQKPFKEIRIYADDHQIKVPYFTETGTHLNGMPLSSGKYTGTARVIIDPTKMDSFNSGDILVTRSTNPSWTPLFTLAGAIVTDMGNYLSHGAIVARELGIPAVGNIFDATKRIKNGQVIFVDGDSGIVYLKQTVTT